MVIALALSEKRETTQMVSYFRKSREVGPLTCLARSSPLTRPVRKAIVTRWPGTGRWQDNTVEARRTMFLFLDRHYLPIPGVLGEPLRTSVMGRPPMEGERRGLWIKRLEAHFR